MLTANFLIRPDQLASFSGVTNLRSSVPVLTSVCVAISAMPAVVSLAAGADVPNVVQLTVLLPMVPLTRSWRYVVAALVPSSIVNRLL